MSSCFEPRAVVGMSGDLREEVARTPTIPHAPETPT